MPRFDRTAFRICSFCFHVSAVYTVGRSTSFPVLPSPPWSCRRFALLEYHLVHQRLEEKYASDSKLPYAAGNGPLCFMDIEVGLVGIHVYIFTCMPTAVLCTAFIKGEYKETFASEFVWMASKPQLRVRYRPQQSGLLSLDVFTVLLGA